MKRVNGMVSDEAKDVLINWKKEKGFTTLDEALQDLLLEFNEQRRPMSSLIEELDELRAEHDTRDAMMLEED